MELATDPQHVDHRVRFEALVGFGDARWQLGDPIAARTSLTEALSIPSIDRRRLARAHEILAELQRRDHRLDEAYAHLQATRELEEEFRTRTSSLARERLVSDAVARTTAAVGAEQMSAEGSPDSGSADDSLLDEAQLDLRSQPRDAADPEEEPAPLERRVESLEQLVDARTRQLERALVDLRDLSNRSQLDALTGLANRQRLNERAGRARRVRRPWCGARDGPRPVRPHQRGAGSRGRRRDPRRAGPPAVARRAFARHGRPVGRRRVRRA